MTQKAALNVLCEGSSENYNKTRKEVKVSIIFPEPTESTQSTLITLRGRHLVKLQ